MIATLAPTRTTTELPLPVVRWLDAAWPDGVDDIETLLIHGPVRIARGGRHLSGHATMSFIVGEAYASDIRIAILGMPVMRGIDARIDGTGIAKIGRTTSRGDEIDQATFIALWCQSVMFPAAWARLPGLRWIPVDDGQTRVELPFRGGFELATLRFDPDGSPFPIAFEADRYRDVGGPKVPWRVELLDWHWFSGIAHPTTLRVSWADEPGPWLELHVVDAVPNEPPGDAFDRARHAIAEAAAAS